MWHTRNTDLWWIGSFKNTLNFCSHGDKGIWWFCSHSFPLLLSLYPSSALFFLTHASENKHSSRNTNEDAHTHKHTHTLSTRTNTHTYFGRRTSSNLQTPPLEIKPFSPTPVRRLTPSTGFLLPWQHAAGWPRGMWVKNLFPWRPVETRRNIKWLVCVSACVCVCMCVCVCVCVHVCMNEAMCVYARTCYDLITVLATQPCIASFPPMMKWTVSKGRDRSSLIDTTLCSVKAFDLRTRATPVRTRANTGTVLLVRTNDCSPHYPPAVCGGVRERGDMKREPSHAHSASPWMSWCEESRREGESWASSLRILLSHESAHALPSTHIIAAVMELFLPPPFFFFFLLVFSLSAPSLPPIHTLARSLPLPFPICHASFRNLCLPLSSFVIPELYRLLPAIFSFPLCISAPTPHPRAPSFLRGDHVLNNFSVCARISHGPPLQQNSGDHTGGFKSFHCHCDVV